MKYKIPFNFKSLLIIILTSVIALSCNNNNSDSDSKKKKKSNRSDNEYAESICDCFEKLGFFDRV